MFSVTVKQIMNDFQLEQITDIKRLEDILITSADVNRPGLQLVGYLEYFGTDRVQIIGKVETTYLACLNSQERYLRLDEFFKCGFPCMVIARGLDVFPEMYDIANKYEIPILRTYDITSRFLSGLISYLNKELAPRTTKHGVFVEVYGEGILILGESGVGKSETALELVKRGHRLVADDVVEIRRVSEKTLVGNAPDIIRHFIEIRGIGILDVKKLYGVGSVKMTEKIKLVIKLEIWDDKKNYDRLGLVDETTDILGINVPCLTIPVRPGRNLAIITEVAAMNNRQKKMGYNAAKALNERVMSEINKSSS
ncbi:MAG: HPr kinase/phosphorylase [Clostridiaceae bacterium]|nr:HPr kinase/phosphorylase [Clostridiaceae bacterium]